MKEDKSVLAAGKCFPRLAGFVADLRPHAVAIMPRRTRAPAFDDAGRCERRVRPPRLSPPRTIAQWKAGWAGVPEWEVRVGQGCENGRRGGVRPVLRSWRLKAHNICLITG